jgi:hypothetical protein
MKILNTSYRDVVATEDALQKTPVSELQLTTELIENSLIHIVQYISGDASKNTAKYESMKMRVQDFEQKIYEAVQNTFNTSYWDTHSVAWKTSHADSTETLPTALAEASFEKMIAYLDSDAPAEIPAIDPNRFIKHLFFDFDVVKRYIVKKNNGFNRRLDDIEIRLDYLDCFFQTNMNFHTTDSKGWTSKSVNHDKNENNDYCQMVILDGNKISNEWRCRATGNLVVYGWLDSTSSLNNKALQSSFCVLEANINGSGENRNWEIIGVQTVIPAKNLTYVGFNVPVKKGLIVRVRTGFTVGAKSSQWANENDGYDTLSNNTANGFKCMIYSNTLYNDADTSRVE